MEPMIFIGGVIVVAGGIWTLLDLLQDAGLLRFNTCTAKKSAAQADQTYSGFRSRDINSSTACRAGFSQ